MGDLPSTSRPGRGAPVQTTPVGATGERHPDHAHPDIRELKRATLEQEQKASDILIQAPLLAGPAAILASITFLKDIAPNPVFLSVLLLLGSWGAYTVGAWRALTSLRLMRSTARDLDQIIESKLDQNDPYLRKGDQDSLYERNKNSEKARVAAMTSFQAGTLLLMLFAVINLPFWGEVFGRVTENPKPPATAYPDTAVARQVAELCRERGCTISFPAPPAPELQPVAPAKQTPGSREPAPRRTPADAISNQGPLPPR